MSFFSCVEERIFCWFFLALTHGNICELFVADGNTIFGCYSFDFWCGVDSWE